MTTEEKKVWQEYYEARKQVVSQVSVDQHEPADVKRARIERLKGDFEAFCEHYFSKYMKAKFGYFHKRDAKAIIKDKKIFAICEYPRAHAKSVEYDIMMPMFLKANGELEGMIIGSNNREKALGLLIDLQVELECNARYIADFGEQFQFGDWEAGKFTTRDGVGFWAFGRGQSPRGTRKAEKRPNYIVVDDIDDKEIVKNSDRVDEAVAWVTEDLMGCFDLKGGRFVVVGNRIHKKSILAHLVGDVEDGDPKNEAIYHSKVYALENPKTHAEDQSENGVPAWKEFYTKEDIIDRMAKMGYRAAQREFFHRHIIQGKVFKSEWLLFEDLPKAKTYLYMVTYCDPSYKGTKHSDFKAIVEMGKCGRFYDVHDIWIAQTNPDKMVVAHYDMQERLEEEGKQDTEHWIEANMNQEVHLEAYMKEYETRGWYLRIRKDDSKKGDKFGRIEALTVLFERGLIRFHSRLRKNPYFRVFKDQLLGFPNAPHDDGPDAMEGAITKLNRKTRTDEKPKIGGFRRNNRY